MEKIAPILLCLILVGQLEAAKTLRIYGRNFSALVTEPKDWTIDVRSAIQIANLVMHKKGTPWREAEIVVFARFIERAADENVTDLSKSYLDQFTDRCPLRKIGDLPLKLTGKQKFLTKTYDCPGGRSEVVAFTKFPGFFGVFILSAREKGAIPSALEPFQELLSSFRWLGKQDSSRAR